MNTDVQSSRANARGSDMLTFRWRFGFPAQTDSPLFIRIDSCSFVVSFYMAQSEELKAKSVRTPRISLCPAPKFFCPIFFCPPADRLSPQAGLPRKSPKDHESSTRRAPRFAAFELNRKAGKDGKWDSTLTAKFSVCEQQTPSPATEGDKPEGIPLRFAYWRIPLAFHP